ncbi:hypothetical protein OF83DRAFT_1294151 [Amylostereum chailletii]|nr:hypothetical protein OF83DRAFT_1294151 [Amylostereum chailletii]
MSRCLIILLSLVARSRGFRSPHTRNKPAELEERLGYFILTKQDPEEPLPPFLPIRTASASSEMPGCVAPLLPPAHKPRYCPPELDAGLIQMLTKAARVSRHGSHDDDVVVADSLNTATRELNMPA